MPQKTDSVFDTSPLSWAEWVFVGVAAAGSFWLCMLWVLATYVASIQ